jgi:hypothetical protein
MSPLSSLPFGYTAENSPVYRETGGGSEGDLAYIAFNRSQEQYLAFKHDAYNFKASGGFTLIAHMAFTGPLQGRHESIFNFGFGSAVASFGRVRSSDYYGATLYNGSDIAAEAPETSGTIVQEKWGYYGALYSAEAKQLFLFHDNSTVIDGVEAEDALPAATEMFFGKPLSPSGTDITPLHPTRTSLIFTAPYQHSLTLSLCLSVPHVINEIKGTSSAPI